MTQAVPLDRRQRRRLETIEQVLDVAADVMAEQGVAGLTLGEVARRMGIRPPSLYVYVDSKNGLYDLLFARGWRLLLAEVGAVVAQEPRDPVALPGLFRESSTAFVRWAVEHPAYAPLMFWRPVPGFVPSAEAYAAALELTTLSRDFLGRLRDGGVLAPGTHLDAAYRAWTVVTTGVITQQLANAPGEPFASGTFTSALPHLTDMWLRSYGWTG